MTSVRTVIEYTSLGARPVNTRLAPDARITVSARGEHPRTYHPAHGICRTDEWKRLVPRAGARGAAGSPARRRCRLAIFRPERQCPRRAVPRDPHRPVGPRTHG